MSISRIDDDIYLVDLETAGMKSFISSYILKGSQVAIVETGPASSVSNLLSALRQLGINEDDVAYVAVSHVHLDHGGGAGTLLKALRRAKLVVHENGAPHMANPEKLWQKSREVLGGIAELYGKPEPVPPDRIVASTDGMEFDIGDGLILKVVETLGHASHHESYFEASHAAVFPGDAAGIFLGDIDVIVPTTPAPFRLDVALASLDRLIFLKPRMLLYTHFGRADNAIERMQFYKRQLTLWTEIAKRGLDNKENMDAIVERIIDADSAVRKAMPLIRNHPVLNETVLRNSVEGVVGFVEKFGCKS